MRIFALKTCDTCRKALKELAAAGHEPTVIDVRADGISGEDLGRFAEVLGEDLVNKRSTTWRGLDDATRARPTVDLLTEYPTLMKRPLIENDGQLCLGWNAATKSALGLA